MWTSVYVYRAGVCGVGGIKNEDQSQLHSSFSACQQRRGEGVLLVWDDTGSVLVMQVTLVRRNAISGSPQQNYLG